MGTGEIERINIAIVIHPIIFLLLSSTPKVPTGGCSIFYNKI
jgi:hypothetical protein